jgi:hypothetical protein
MATTGTFNGNLIIPKWGSNVIGCTTDSSLSLSYETIDATCKDNDGSQSSLPGQQSGEISLSGLQKFDATLGIEDLRTDFSAKTERVIEWSTQVTGDQKWSATAFISSLNENAPLNGVATYDVTFTFKGAISLGTVS